MSSLHPSGYFHPDSLSPDPCRGETSSSAWREKRIHPHALVYAAPGHWPALRAWSEQLHLTRPAPPLTLETAGVEELDFILDFGTELAGQLHLEIESASPGVFCLQYGESYWEAKDWGLPSRCAEQSPLKQHWRITAAGRYVHESPDGGLRFVRVRAVDFAGAVTIHAVWITAHFAFAAQSGDFACSDPVLQKLWQAAAYTARLCARPGELWDGIKRDRLGWYGDARITQSAINWAFHDLEAVWPMLLRLEAGRWANAIPNYSCDALAILRGLHCHHLLPEDQLAEVMSRVEAFMDWVLTTQTDPDGCLVRREDVPCFFEIGFTDWSVMPIGGRWEELACLQFAWLECLENYLWLARATGRAQHVERVRAAVTRLHPILTERFWAEGLGYHHTLNQCEPLHTPWRMPHQPGLHFEKTYREGLRFGPSGPSRQAAARAVWADLPGPAQRAALLGQVFANPAVPPIITPYYRYYENQARALCGDVEGALADMTGYLRPMIETYGSTTLWESFEPETVGVASYSINNWPKSLCHGWSSGLVDLVNTHLLGIRIEAPAFRRISFDPCLPNGLAVQATVPTPYGPMVIEKAAGQDRVEARFPKEIEVIRPNRAG